MTARRAIARAVAVAALTASAAGCTPKPGDACNTGQSACADATRALACVGGVYVAASCRGPAGCRVEAGRAACDDTIAAAGDPCADEATASCSPDRAALVECRGGAFVVTERCRGPRACAIEAGVARCDVGAAAAADPCRREGNHACALDGHDMLVCEHGAFRAAMRCRGPLGCAVRDDRVACDDAIAAPGEPCDAEGDVACTEDGARLLTCRAHAWATSRACRRCAVASGVVRCD